MLTIVLAIADTMTSHTCFASILLSFNQHTYGEGSRVVGVICFGGGMARGERLQQIRDSEAAGKKSRTGALDSSVDLIESTKNEIVTEQRQRRCGDCAGC